MLAQRGADATLSLAGRTATPVAMPLPTRHGGFGGIAGLVEYLRTSGTEALVDATHPYAAAMSHHAAEASALAPVKLLALRRPAWRRQEGDDWLEVGDAAEAVSALGAAPRRAFLALGRQELRPFEAAPQHRYLIRSVDPVEPPLAVPDALYVVARGPFDIAWERLLLESEAVDTIICKNSGGTATYGKIAVARALGLRVIMLRRPTLPEAESVATPEAAMEWLAHAGMLRGV